MVLRIEDTEDGIVSVVESDEKTFEVVQDGEAETVRRSVRDTATLGGLDGDLKD